jgi:hypothetical protein
MLSAVCGFIGFNVALLAAHLLAAPPQLWDPACNRYLGRWLYLTYQTNVGCAVYFGCALLDMALGGGGALGAALVALFPLAFALGGFLTVAYYALDHFNPENYARKERVRSQYPYVHWCSHLEHGHGLPLMLLHGLWLDVPAGVVPPETTDVVHTVGAYMAFYLLLVHANYAATGLWPYPIIDDLTRAGGALARGAFFAGLSLVFVLFGLGGAMLLRSR